MMTANIIKNCFQQKLIIPSFFSLTKNYFLIYALAIYVKGQSRIIDFLFANNLKLKSTPKRPIICEFKQKLALKLAENAAAIVAL